jgi:hypothetical protein
MFFQNLDIWSALTFWCAAHIDQEAEGSQTPCILLFAVIGDLRQRAAQPYMACALISLYQLVSICQQNDHSSVADIPPPSANITRLPRMTIFYLFQIYRST